MHSLTWEGKGEDSPSVPHLFRRKFNRHSKSPPSAPTCGEDTHPHLRLWECPIIWDVPSYGTYH